MPESTSIFQGLTFHEIFIGSDGFPVLASSMLIALAGNLFKKYTRYDMVSDGNPFDIRKWLRENWDDMLVGFFVTYFLVRLLNTMSVIFFNIGTVKQLIPDPHSIPVSEVLIIVSVFIGYYTDKIIEKAFSIKTRKKEKNGRDV